MRAIKGNKAYTVDGPAAKAYAARGYDVYGDDGRLALRGAGRTVPAERYDEALARIAELEAELAGRAAGGPTRDELAAQAESLGVKVPSKATKAQIADLIAAARPQEPAE